MRRLLLPIGWLLIVPAALAAGADVEARVWAPDLAGLVQVGAGEGGTDIDLGADLGIADDEAPAALLVWRPTRRVSVRLDYISFDFAGSAVLDRAIEFGGSSFDVDVQVDSRLELELGGIGVAWQFLSSGDGRLRLGPLVEARGIRGAAAIDAEVLGILPLRAREEFELGFAAAGLVLDIEPTRRLSLQARWTTSVETDEGDLTDAEAAVRFQPLERLALTAGYRRIEIDAADGLDRFDLELDGPFFGGMLRF